jgi:hypothetical protein
MFSSILTPIAGQGLTSVLGEVLGGGQDESGSGPLPPPGPALDALSMRAEQDLATPSFFQPPQTDVWKDMLALCAGAALAWFVFLNVCSDEKD